MGIQLLAYVQQGERSMDYGSATLTSRFLADRCSAHNVAYTASLKRRHSPATSVYKALRTSPNGGGSHRAVCCDLYGRIDFAPRHLFCEPKCRLSLLLEHLPLARRE